MAASIRSNFDVFRAHEGQPWRLGAMAERYFAGDPNTSACSNSDNWQNNAANPRYADRMERRQAEFLVKTRVTSCVD